MGIEISLRQINGRLEILISQDFILCVTKIKNGDVGIQDAIV